MSPDKLVYMANQIATFFQTRKHEEALSGISDHINNFWEPRMRAQFFAIVDAGGAGLMPLVVEASGRIKRPKTEPAG